MNKIVDIHSGKVTKYIISNVDYRNRASSSGSSSSSSSSTSLGYNSGYVRSHNQSRSSGYARHAPMRESTRKYTEQLKQENRGRVFHSSY